jgi:YidC/Oxa1 family membrane protein insertase
MLDQAARKGKAHGFMDEELAESYRDATFLGNVKVSGTFMNADSAGVMIVAALLVIAMTATTFLTQRQLMSKNMPADALTGPYAQQQKMLLYVLPIVFAVGGIAFPIGVLVYWTVSNLWTMGQQFYVIRNNPAPGTPAAAAKEERDRAKAERKGIKTPAMIEQERLAAEAEAKREERAQTRQQPQRQTKAQRNKNKKKR